MNLKGRWPEASKGWCLVARRPRKEEGSPFGGSAHWMTTYSDMVTLLLCFFVLLFAFSSVDIQKFRAIMSAFQGSIGVLDSGRALHQEDRIEDAALEMDVDQVMMQPTMQELRQLQDIFDTLQNWAAQQELDGLVYMVMEERASSSAADRVLLIWAKQSLREAKGPGQDGEPVKPTLIMCGWRSIRTICPSRPPRFLPTGSCRRPER